ncbi:MAG: T9SS type A sorting domain-containing protein [Salibacteraceae bacterium]
MKALFTLFLSLSVSLSLFAQGSFCASSGNVVLFTNYDGGNLTIDVNENIPNLKIGIVAYEAISVTLTGTYAGNVTEVRYAGYNASTTLFFNTGSAATSAVFAPSATLPNSNGNGSIICGYSCNTSSSQGGCNTVDQIEDYWQGVFSSYSLYFHRVQYGSWSGTQTISAGGDCCALFVPLTSSATSTNETCFGECDGTAEVIASGGQSPYTYAWSNSSTTATVNNLCPGTYYVTTTDAANEIIIDTVVIDSAAELTSMQTLSLCAGDSVSVGNNTYNSNGIYNDTLTSSSGCDSIVITDLTVSDEIFFPQYFSASSCEGIEIEVGNNTYSETGVYIDTLQAGNGCDSVVQTTIQVNQDSLIEEQPEDRSRFENQNAKFEIVLTNPSANLIWQENDGTGYITLSSAGIYSGATTEELTVSNVTLGMDNYAYRCIASYQLCQDTSDVAKLTVKKSLGVNELSNDDYSVYPNPSKGKLFISSQKNRFESSTVDLFDLQGKRVMETQTWNTSEIFEIELGELSSGQYILMIDDQQQVIVKE